MPILFTVNNELGPVIIYDNDGTKLNSLSINKEKEIADPLQIKVLAGVFLLKSAKNASFINRVVPGACIPDSIISRLENAKDPFIEGIAIAAEQIRDFSGITQGIHLMAVKAEKYIPEILEKSNINFEN